MKIFQAKPLLATFIARNANLKLLDDDAEKRKKKLDRPAEGVHARLRRSVVDLLSLDRCRSFSKSVVFSFFEFLASLKKLYTIHEVCLFFFFRLSRAERNFSQGRWRPRGNALSMARQPNVGRACGWLFSAVFWSWVEKALISLTVFKVKNEMRVHTRFARICNIFRVTGVIVRMPYLPSWKVRWDNSICKVEYTFIAMLLPFSTTS